MYCCICIIRLEYGLTHAGNPSGLIIAGLIWVGLDAGMTFNVMDFVSHHYPLLISNNYKRSWRKFFIIHLSIKNVR